MIGASGGVGVPAVQLAKEQGARVTAVCSGAKADFVRGLGADRVLDYAREDFAAGDARYDVILDMVHDRPHRDYRRVLVRGGRCVMVAAGQGRWIGGMHRVLGAVLASRFSSRKMLFLMAVPNGDDLAALAERVAQGRLACPTDRVFPLAETANAFRRFESGAAQGAVVVTP